MPHYLLLLERYAKVTGNDKMCVLFIEGHYTSSEKPSRILIVSEFNFTRMANCIRIECYHRNGNFHTDFFISCSANFSYLILHMSYPRRYLKAAYYVLKGNSDLLQFTFYVK